MWRHGRKDAASLYVDTMPSPPTKLWQQITPVARIQDLVEEPQVVLMRMWWSGRRSAGGTCLPRAPRLECCVR